jgi:hypothetical protein
MKKYLWILIISVSISCTKKSLQRDSVYDRRNYDLPVVLNCTASADSLSDYYELRSWEKNTQGLVMYFADNDKNYISRKTNNHPPNMKLTVHFSENNSNFQSKGFSSNIVMVYVNTSLLSTFTVDPFQASKLVVNLQNLSAKEIEIKIVGKCSDGNADMLKSNRIHITKICLL